MQKKDKEEFASKWFYRGLTFGISSGIIIGAASITLLWAKLEKDCSMHNSRPSRPLTVLKHENTSINSID